MLALFLRPRYLVAWLVVSVVAAVCCIAGVWQWERLHEKHAANIELRSNSKDTAITAQDLLPDARSAGAADAAQNAKLRQVSATGVYDSSNEVVVRGQTVGTSQEGAGDVGFLVLTPLRLDSGQTALVVRGFIKATQDALATPAIPAPPTGEVTIVARVRPADPRPDKFGQLPQRQVDSINSADASARLGVPVLAGYLELEADQPGVAGLIAIPAPDLSNPAGGALEPQHLAYVIQWFVFALLALALPFVLARSDLRAGDDPKATGTADPGRLSPVNGAEHPVRADPDPPGTTEQQDRLAAKLADRYGR